MKPPAAAAHAHVALGAQRVDGARGERLRGGHGREAELLGAAPVPSLVLRERGELPEQPLGSVGISGPASSDDVGAQRLDLADRDLVRGTSPLHDHAPGYHGARAVRNTV